MGGRKFAQVFDFVKALSMSLKRFHDDYSGSHRQNEGNGKRINSSRIFQGKGYPKISESKRNFSVSFCITNGSSVSSIRETVCLVV